MAGRFGSFNVEWGSCLSREETVSDLRQFPNRGVGPAPDERGRRSELLARRLEYGYRRIDQAIATGSDVTAWESFWIALLHEYEAVCDELREAA
jgi:hypothetical protein